MSKKALTFTVNEVANMIGDAIIKLINPVSAIDSDSDWNRINDSLSRILEILNNLGNESYSDKTQITTEDGYIFNITLIEDSIIEPGDVFSDPTTYAECLDNAFS